MADQPKKDKGDDQVELHPDFSSDPLLNKDPADPQGTSPDLDPDSTPQTIFQPEPLIPGQKIPVDARIEKFADRGGNPHHKYHGGRPLDAVAIDEGSATPFESRSVKPDTSDIKTRNEKAEDKGDKAGAKTPVSDAKVEEDQKLRDTQAKKGDK